MKHGNKFFMWVMLNIILPISPLLIKASINFFTNDNMSEIPILDGIELIYYNLFLSVTMINLLNNKTRLIDNILRVLFIVICSLDLITLMLFYLKLDNNKCFTYSIIMFILVPLFLGIYKYRLLGEMEDE